MKIKRTTYPYILSMTLLSTLFLLVSCGHTRRAKHSEKEKLSSQEKKLQPLTEEIVREIRKYIQKDLIPEIRPLQQIPKDVLNKQRKAKLSLKNKTLIGRIEYIEIDNTGFTLKARVDTGAKTCSLHAEDIIEKQMNGKKYIQFTSENTKGKKQVFFKEVIKDQKVKSSNGEVNTRYVVKMNIAIGVNSHFVNVNLNDRDDLRYNFLIGRNLLMGDYIVDVSQTRLLGQ